MREKDPVLMAFGAALRRERIRAGYSQEALAHIAGIDRTQTSVLERGMQDPRLTTIVKLCDALEITPQDLLDDLKRR